MVEEEKEEGEGEEENSNSTVEYTVEICLHPSLPMVAHFGGTPLWWYPFSQYLRFSS